MSKLCGVILDVDGTLIDSNEAHINAWEQALQQCGYPVARERIEKLIGMGGDKLLPAVIGVEKKSVTGKLIDDTRTRIFREHYLSVLQPFPQVKQLLEHMRSKGLRLIVASSGEPEEIETLLKRAGVYDLLEDTTSSDDAKNSKPDPDIVQAALRTLKCPAPHVLMLGDTPYDIEAASKLGINVIALRCGGRSDDELSGALAIYDDPADLLAHYDTSPLAAE